MALIPEYIKKLKPYQAGKGPADIIGKYSVTNISKLASNENPLGPSPKAVKEMTKILWDTHRYPDMYAKDLKSVLAARHNLRPENVILGNGSESIMSNIMRTFVSVGQKVMSPTCTFIGFKVMANGTGVELIETPLRQDYSIDTKKLISSLNDEIRILYLANPNNPTGTYINKADLEEVMSHIPKQCLVILDEAYFEFCQHIHDYPDSMNYRFDNVITLRTFSKAYGLSGVRIGYGLGHPYLIEQLHKIKLPFEPSLIAQRGAIGALEDYNHLEITLKNNKDMLHQLKDYFDQLKINYIPSVANFISIDLKTESKANAMFEALLQHGVIVRPLKSNDMPSYLRVSIGNREEIDHFKTAFKINYTKLNQLG